MFGKVSIYISTNFCYTYKMNSPTWALVTEAKRLLVLVSTDLELIKNIQLCVSKHVLLNLVPWKNEEVRFESNIIGVREKLLFVKSVLVKQQEYSKRILDEYEPINQQDVKLLGITKNFYSKVMPNDAFIPATIAAEIADLNKYHDALDDYNKFVYSILFNLNYSLSVEELKKSFKAEITNISNWPDKTDRFFIFGGVTGMYTQDFK